MIEESFGNLTSEIWSISSVLNVYDWLPSNVALMWTRFNLNGRVFLNFIEFVTWFDWNVNDVGVGAIEKSNMMSSDGDGMIVIENDESSVCFSETFSTKLWYESKYSDEEGHWC